LLERLVTDLSISCSALGVLAIQEPDVAPLLNVPVLIGLISGSFCERIDSEEVAKGCGIRWSIPLDVQCCFYCVIPTDQRGFLSFYDQYWSIQSGYLTLFYMHALSSLCQSFLMNVPRATPFSRDTICVLYSN
jgi:hypothetical protein